MTCSSWRLFKHPSGTCYAAYVLLLYRKYMPPPSHMERRRSIDVSPATPSFCTDEVILLLCAVSSTSLCISQLCFGRCSPFQAVETLWKRTRAQRKICSGHLTPFTHQSEKTAMKPIHPLAQCGTSLYPREIQGWQSMSVFAGPDWRMVKYLLKPAICSHWNSDGQMRICRSQLNSLISLSKLPMFLCRMTLAVLKRPW